MTQPTSDQWRKLYDLARQIQEMAPWQWLQEDDIFGVQDPDTGQMGFVSVMGSGGEHFAIAVYQGAAGLHQFLYIQDSYDMLGDEVALDILEVPQLQLSYEDREFVETKDRAVMKELGLKFRGRNAWPLFRSTEPGWLPWFISTEEARFLTIVLEQLLEFAPHLQKPNTFFDSFQEDRFLVRVARKENQKLTWEDQMTHIPFSPAGETVIAIDVKMLSDLQKLPVARMTLELDVFNLMSPTLDENGRPFFPYMLLMVDAKSGMILGQEMLQPEPDLNSIWARTPNAFMAQCVHGIRARPSTLHVATEYLYEMFKPLAKQLGIKVVLKDELPALDEALQSLMGMMGSIGF